MRLKEVAEYIKADLVVSAGDAEAAGLLPVRGVAPVLSAGDGDITFLTAGEYEKYLPSCKASALITGTRQPGFAGPQLIHKNPYWAFARTAQLFHRPARGPSGVSEDAFIAEDAVVHESATIYPFAYIGSRARLAADTVIFPGAMVGDDAEIGEGTVVRANVVIEAGVRIGSHCLVHAGTVIGADGFGFAAGDEGLAKIPQTGSVVIGNDVEIGAACTIDRGAMENTVIGDGTKLDSHVHVGHNVQVGRHCMLCGFTGLAGSAKVGDWVVLAGHSAVSNRCSVADGTQVGGMSVVTKNIPNKGTYLGFPAMPAADWRRQVAHTRRLPDLDARVKELEAKLEALSAQLLR